VIAAEKAHIGMTATTEVDGVRFKAPSGRPPEARLGACGRRPIRPLRPRRPSL
jgi:hypothetical protein